MLTCPSTAASLQHEELPDLPAAHVPAALVASGSHESDKTSRDRMEQPVVSPVTFLSVYYSVIIDATKNR